MKNLPNASPKIEAEAKKLFLYKKYEPKEYAVLGQAVLEEKSEYLYFRYKDKALDSWITDVRNIFGDSVLYRKAENELKMLEIETIADRDWKVDIEKLRRLFPNENIPLKLVKLAEYQNQLKGYITSFFVVDQGLEKIPKNFKKGSSDKLIVFGGYVDGSSFAFWLYNKSQPSKAPIVFIDCDWEGSSVIANNFEDFLKLLATSDSCIALYSEEDNLDERIEKQIKSVRKWLKQQFNIEPAKFPNRIIQNAKSKHPGFLNWLNNSVK